MNQARPVTSSENDIYANPPDIAELELEPGHPGLGDEAYIERRKALFSLCREHRLKSLGPPLIQYTPRNSVSGARSRPSSTRST